jgi:hypothetical protein
MARADKRQDKKIIQAIAKKAKQQMIDWVDGLGYTPNELEIKAWQAGYIAGLNQANESR